MHLDAVGRQHLDHILLGRRGKRVGILAEKERAIDAGLPAIFADRLGDGENMCLIETAVQGTTTMATGAK